MRATIHQPNYLPGLSYFAKIARSDVFILLDDVQFTKNNWTNRNRIKGPRGEQWLTLPVITAGRLHQRIVDVELDVRAHGPAKHWKQLQTCYGRAPAFAEIATELRDVLLQDWVRLAPLNEALLHIVLRRLSLPTPVVRSSDLNVEGESAEKLIRLCQAVGASSYLSGPGGKKYLDVARFTAEAITVEFHEFTHPVYGQMFGDFLPNLSIVDLLFNEGRNAANVLASLVAA
jgi:hypothetical protein